MKKLFEPMSPMVGWLFLMEAFSVLGLMGCWTQALHPPIWQRWGVGSALGATALFAGSNYLLVRRRAIGIVGMIVFWLWLGLLMLPTI